MGERRAREQKVAQCNCVDIHAAFNCCECNLRLLFFLVRCKFRHLHGLVSGWEMNAIVIYTLMMHLSLTLVVNTCNEKKKKTVKKLKIQLRVPTKILLLLVFMYNIA